MQEEHDWMDVERRSGTYAFGVEEGLEQGLEQGRRQALLEVLLGVLAERGLTIDEPSEATIRACTDAPTLQRWVRRAVHATSVAELFEDR